MTTRHDACDSVLTENNESLQNGVATHFQVTLLFLMAIESLASSQSGRSINADALCKRALRSVFRSCVQVESCV